MADQGDELGTPQVLAFPLRGIDAEHPFDLQPPMTTPIALNVCAVDPESARARGGSRPGLGRFLPMLPTRGPVQHLEIIVDPQADALTADFGELPLNYLMQYDWIDDPSVGYGHISGLFRNRGQVPRGGSGRDTGWNIRKVPTKIQWSNPADITAGEELTAAQLSASAVEAPGGIIAILGTFEYSPSAGTVLSVGTATLKVKFTPTDESFYKGCVGQVRINVTKSTPIIVWNDPSDMSPGQPLTSSQLNAQAKHEVTNEPISGKFVYSPSSGTVLNEGEDQALSVDFTPTNQRAYDNASKTVHIDVNGPEDEIGPDQILSSTAITAGSESDTECTVKIVLSDMSEIEVSATVDPGTDAVPNTNPDWGGVGEGSLIPGVHLAVPCGVEVRFVKGHEETEEEEATEDAWYYYLPPFI